MYGLQDFRKSASALYRRIAKCKNQQGCNATLFGQFLLSVPERSFSSCRTMCADDFILYDAVFVFFLDPFVGLVLVMVQEVGGFLCLGCGGEDGTFVIVELAEESPDL